MTQIMEEHVRKAIENKRGADLDKIARAAVPTETLVRLLTQAAVRGGERMTQATHDKIRYRQKRLRRVANGLENLRCEALKLLESDPFEGVQKPVYEEFIENQNLQQVCKLARERFIARCKAAGLKKPKLAPMRKVIEQLATPINERLAKLGVAPWYKVNPGDTARNSALRHGVPGEANERRS
jgi:hypothetical protein